LGRARGALTCSERCTSRGWRDIIASRSESGAVPLTRLAFLETELVGTVTVCWDDSDEEYADEGPWLTAMFVQGPARNLGVGRALLADVEQGCRDLGFGDLWLHTAEAERFYERCGWHVVRPRAYLGTDTVMRRTLPE
jgi:GNAT superfamily N-acetyltransferase